MVRAILILCCVLSSAPSLAGEAVRFDGKHFSGTGDVQYLELLDTARRQFEPDPHRQSVHMLYEPKWNGLVEGPTWDAWWIQNSYGTTFCWLPWMSEPYVTFVQNSQDLWFDHQGDGKRADRNGYVAPDGCLVDAASPTQHYYRQGDGKHAMHDWGMEFTAAGVVLQSELLLIGRDGQAIERYLPKLERAANFIETRRDPKTGLYQGGVACNLLAPSFGGYLKPDGTRGMAFHAGLQVTYIAALDRLIELETLAGHANTAAGYERRRDLAKQSLSKLTTDEGYFVNSIDPDGTKHGVFGAAKHGYFESSVNHDAVCFRVADDEQAKKIMAKMLSIPQLRPHALVIPNYPSYDDIYEPPQGLWAYGYWVNGGHWSTCEARMQMAYYRTGHHADAAAAMRQILKFASQFRMDNDLTDFGNAPYQPNQPINLTYDAFGVAAGFLRGLFEYRYSADKLTLVPHVPKTIRRLEQKDPVRFGTKRIFVSTAGAGHVSSVKVNGEVWTQFSTDDVTLPYDATPEAAKVEITLGYDAPPAGDSATPATTKSAVEPPAELAERFRKLGAFRSAMKKAGLTGTYADAHAALAERAFGVIAERKQLAADGKIETLPEPSATAAEKSYVDAANKLFDGLVKVMERYARSHDPQEQQVEQMWR
jgi:hypothetical protein